MHVFRGMEPGYPHVLSNAEQKSSGSKSGKMLVCG